MAKYTGKQGLWAGLDPDENVSADTHTHNHTPTPTHIPKVKETKDRRVQLLTYGSLVDRMDTYAKMNGLSRAEVFEQAVSEFLDRNS